MKFLPSEEKINSFWDAYATIGDKIDPLTKGYTRLNLKFPDNSFPQKLYEFSSQPKPSEANFNWPNIFKRPAKELFTTDKKAKTRFHAAFQAECLLDNLSNLLQAFCESGNNNHENAVELLNWTSTSLVSINKMFAGITSELLEDTIKAKINLRKAAIIHQSIEIKNKLCSADKFSLNSLPGLVEVKKILGSIPPTQMLETNPYFVRHLAQAITTASKQSATTRGRGGYPYRGQGNRGSSQKRNAEPQPGPSGYQPNKAAKPNPPQSSDNKREDGSSNQKFRGGRGKRGRK